MERACTRTTRCRATGLFCTTGDACSGGDCGGVPDRCADDVECTIDTCNEATDSCLNSPDDSECSDDDSCTFDTCNPQTGCTNVFACIDICRPSTFYSRRAVGDDSLTQRIIDAVGGLEVCGQTITSTANDEEPFLEGLGLSSALEAMCVRIEHVAERALFQQLVTTALNCAISGSDNCDEVVGEFISLPFSTCNQVCEEGLDDEELAGECIRQLDCYNRGGQFFNDRCALGICNVTGQFCGAEYGACPPFASIPVVLLQTCERFPTNCRDEEFCQPALDICPERVAGGGSRACREAKRNDCTIDSCDVNED
jgi:hypothetical protein